MLKQQSQRILQITDIYFKKCHEIPENIESSLHVPSEYHLAVAR